VKSRDDGWFILQVSWTSSWNLKSLRAFSACSFSGRAGALSSASSIILKSPIMKSGLGSLFSCHVLVNRFQNSSCCEWVFGAYIFANVKFVLLCHFVFIANALPGMISVVIRSSGLNISLFIMNATPAEFPGRCGSLEFIIFNLHE
jgi:hypothetical protein